mmetsp:Transcript_14633/g.24937  ORF Transcript_14633/g.24937 Transcript_14633/m.24937 type:complete len:84 (+) Transcript_14633:148-399(+)
MLLNILLCFWSYSAYLTLREGVILIYFLLLALSTLWGLVYGIQSKRDNVQVIGLLVISTFYALNCYFNARAYIYFRLSGGIKG